MTTVRTVRRGPLPLVQRTCPIIQRCRPAAGIVEIDMGIEKEDNMDGQMADNTGKKTTNKRGGNGTSLQGPYSAVPTPDSQPLGPLHTSRAHVSPNILVDRHQQLYWWAIRTLVTGRQRWSYCRSQTTAKVQ